MCQTSLVCTTSLQFQNSSAYQVMLSELCFLNRRPQPCKHYRIHHTIYAGIVWKCNCHKIS